MYVKPEMKAIRMNLKYEVMALSSLNEEGAKDVYDNGKIF